jgi:hypothetical protein
VTPALEAQIQTIGSSLAHGCAPNDPAAQRWNVPTPPGALVREIGRGSRLATVGILVASNTPKLLRRRQEHRETLRFGAAADG